jgi:hypothetical protein
MAPLVAALLALQAAPAARHDWWYVTVSGPAGDQNAHYGDRTSIRRTGNRVLMAEAREAETADDRGIISARLEMEYDCRARTGRIVTATRLAAGGRVVEQGNARETLHPITPDSVYDAMLRFACGDSGGLEQLGTLGIREQALLLFADRAAHLRNHPDEAN